MQLAASADIGPKTAPGADLFTNGPVLRLNLNIKKEDMDSLRKDPRNPVHAILQESSKTYSNVAVHLKGAAGSFRGVDDRPALTLDFDKFGKQFRSGSCAAG
jgi:spore coat protein H